MGEAHEDPREGDARSRAVAESWAAFAAGMFDSSPDDEYPLIAWEEIHRRLKSPPFRDCPFATPEHVQREAARWATANLPAEVLLRRRWF